MAVAMSTYEVTSVKGDVVPMTALYGSCHEHLRSCLCWHLAACFGHQLLHLLLLWSRVFLVLASAPSLSHLPLVVTLLIILS